MSKKCLVCGKDTKPLEYRLGKSTKITNNYCSKECMDKYKGETKTKLVFNTDKRYAENLPEDGHIIKGGTMKSKDNISIQVFYRYDAKKHEYIPHTSWGEELVYSNDFASFIPKTYLAKYKKEKRRKKEEDKDGNE